MHPVLRRGALAGLRVLPKHVLSHAVGRAAALRLPPSLQRWTIRRFGRAVGVEFGEIRDPIESFTSLQAFFTRALRDGARPIDPGADAVVAPCDGAWGASGAVSNGTLLQVKGHTYSLARLLGDAARAAAFEGGAYATFYLAPRDYHRFHMPCAARIRRATYLPGALWPVNGLGVAGIDGLFARNERICAYFAVQDEAIDLCLVAVGATLVGSVRVAFDDLRTNEWRRHRVDRDYPGTAHRFAKGEEWGRFEFGSTIVMIAAPRRMRLDTAPSGQRLRVGERIGTLHPGGP